MKKFSKKEQDGWGIVIISCVVALAIFVGIFFIASGSEAPCPRDKKAGHRLILIDKTDPFTEQQKQWIRNEVLDVSRIATIIKLHERLSVFVLDEKPVAAPRPLFSECRPKTRSEANIVTETPETIHSKYKMDFQDPLAKTVEEIIASKETKLSPIFEMIHEISLLDDFRDDYGHRQLVIYSDMLQNTSELSLYSICNPASKNGQVKCKSYGEVKENHSSYFEQIAPRFGDRISVKMYILRRPGHQNVPPDDELRKFWAAFFMDHGIKFDSQTDTRFEPNIY